MAQFAPRAHVEEEVGAGRDDEGQREEDRGRCRERRRPAQAGEETRVDKVERREIRKEKKKKRKIGHYIFHHFQ